MYTNMYTKSYTLYTDSGPMDDPFWTTLGSQSRSILDPYLDRYPPILRAYITTLWKAPHLGGVWNGPIWGSGMDPQKGPNKGSKVVILGGPKVHFCASKSALWDLRNHPFWTTLGSSFWTSGGPDLDPLLDHLL